MDIALNVSIHVVAPLPENIDGGFRVPSGGHRGTDGNPRGVKTAKRRPVLRLDRRREGNGDEQCDGCDTMPRIHVSPDGVGTSLNRSRAHCSPPRRACGPACGGLVHRSGPRPEGSSLSKNDRSSWNQTSPSDSCGSSPFSFRRPSTRRCTRWSRGRVAIPPRMRAGRCHSRRCPHQAGAHRHVAPKTQDRR